MVARAGFQAQGLDLGQLGLQVADQLDFLRGIDLALGVVQQLGGDAGVAQQGVQVQAAVQTQLDEDPGGGDASAEVPHGFAGCFGDHDATHS